jgi:hypothetical protein
MQPTRRKKDEKRRKKRKKKKKKKKKKAACLPTLLAQFPKAAGSFAWPYLATDHTNGATPQTCLQKIDDFRALFIQFIPSL